MRSFLTMLGIIIGVAAVVLIMGLGNGMRQSVTDSVTGDKDGYLSKGEELDPAYADLSQPTKPVKEVWLEQVAKQTPGIDSYL